MSSFDAKDPANIIFKTTRNDYLNNIRLRCCINMKFECDPFKYLTLHKKLLIGLRLSNILRKAEIRIKNADNWNTTIYFSIEVGDNFIFHNSYGTSLHPFVLCDIDSTKYSVGSFRNIWKVKRKKKEMDHALVSYKSVITSNQTKFHISENLININKINIENWKNNLLENVKCSNITEYFIKLNKLTSDSSYSLKLILGWEKIIDISYNDIFMLNFQITKEHLLLLKEFQKFVSLSILENNVFTNKTFHLPTFVDNRGRQYYSTIISPTFNKLFRYLYSFNEKKTFIDLESSTFYKKIISYRNLIYKFNLDDKNSYILIVLLIEIGKFFIITNECFIKTEEIINIGIKNYEERSKNIDFYDLLYIEKIYSEIDNLLNGNVCENFIIFKDATASGLQNYGVLLGYKEEKLKYLNINGDDYCDTYQYVIELYLKNKNFSKRKYWKSTIMTIPYNAEWFSCFTKFIKSLRKDGIEYNKLDKNEQKEIQIMHRDFYNNVKNNIKTELYQNKKADLKFFSYNKWTVVNKKEYKITYKKARDKYTDTLYLLDYDHDATMRALEANNMHNLDSNLIKKIFEKIEILSIHDCIGSRLCELHLVMDIINEYYSEHVGFSTYNIHVIK
jgi:hypothetical protein